MPADRSRVTRPILTYLDYDDQQIEFEEYVENFLTDPLVQEAALYQLADEPLSPYVPGCEVFFVSYKRPENVPDQPWSIIAAAFLERVSECLMRYRQNRRLDANTPLYVYPDRDRRDDPNLWVEADPRIWITLTFEVSTAVAVA
jgi:hypothetical protein